MPKQDFRNHNRFIYHWHIMTPVILLAILCGGIINLLHTGAGDKHSAWLLLGIAVVLPFLWFYERRFALIAQDRAIRAEENFRHFLLTGKPHDSRLRLGQIIALRFASDEEMPGLAIKAVEEKLGVKQIKQSIRNWRADEYRV